MKKQSQPGNDPIFTNKRVVVAEDNRMNQKVLCLQLSRFGIEPEIVTSGRELIQRVEHGTHLDLIIMDLRMPELNGLQATLYLHDQLKSAIPIIGMTASGLDSDRRKCIECGMDGFLAKPFPPGALLKVLQEFLDDEGTDPSGSCQDTCDQTCDKLYDLSGLVELQEPGFVAEILIGFLTNVPIVLEEIRLSSICEQWEEVFGRAHQLKTSAGLLQMTYLIGQLNEIEQLSFQKDYHKIVETVKFLEEWFRGQEALLEQEIKKSLLSPK